MDEKDKALQFAMKLIGLRRRSVFEIEERLKVKSYSEDIVSYVIEELKKFRYLDDEIFAESFINDRINLRPCGKRFIEKELRNKGISSEIIESKLGSMIDEEKELELAQRLILKKMRSITDGTDKNKIKRKLAAYLSTKGFSFDVIGQVLRNKLK